jgi:hypothetical protein
LGRSDRIGEKTQMRLNAISSLLAAAHDWHPAVLSVFNIPSKCPQGNKLETGYRSSISVWPQPGRIHESPRQQNSGHKYFTPLESRPHRKAHQQEILEITRKTHSGGCLAVDNAVSPTIGAAKTQTTRAHGAVHQSFSCSNLSELYPLPPPF